MVVMCYPNPIQNKHLTKQQIDLPKKIIFDHPISFSYKQKNGWQNCTKRNQNSSTMVVKSTILSNNQLQ